MNDPHIITPLDWALEAMARATSDRADLREAQAARACAERIAFGSVCSGIEAASVAWHPLGWRASWLAEIEPFPSAVLAHHYPDVPNLGDMTKLAAMIRAGQIDAPDVFCGGTPCQSFSVAGLRRSLDDARGNLSLTFCEIADAIDAARSAGGREPAVIFWENVPGVLNTKDNAFGCFLAGLAGESDPLIAPGGKWPNAGAVFGPSRAIAWRVLDAQYFGVAQRRRRVFVVASARTGFDPAAVLFEFDGVRRDSAPRREAGEGSAAGTLRSTDGGCDVDHARAGHVAGALTARFGRNAGAANDDIDGGRLDFESETRLVQPVAFDTTQITSPKNFSNPQPGSPCHPLASGAHPPVISFHGRNQGRDEVQPAHTLRGEGFDASPQETDAGKILRALRQEVGEKAFAQWGLGILDSLQQAEVLRQALHGLSVRPATFSRSWVVYCALSRSEDRSRWLPQSLREAGCERCASQGWQPPEQLARELGAYLSELSRPGAQAERFVHDLWQASQGIGLLRQALSAVQEVWRPAHGEGQSAHGGMQVRRLTVEECEFLQGFPRGYSRIPWRKKPASECPDGPRYKALGNSWAVPNVRWIGQRIDRELRRLAASNDNHPA